MNNNYKNKLNNLPNYIYDLFNIIVNEKNMNTENYKKVIKNFVKYFNHNISDINFDKLKNEYANFN
jgi:uncharacterized protein YaaR (DUF327 family)